MLLERAGNAESGVERGRVMADIGRIYASELGDRSQAMVAYTQAFCEDPGDGRIRRRSRAPGRIGRRRVVGGDHHVRRGNQPGDAPGGEDAPLRAPRRLVRRQSGTTGSGDGVLSDDPRPKPARRSSSRRAVLGLREGPAVGRACGAARAPRHGRAEPGLGAQLHGASRRAVRAPPGRPHAGQRALPEGAVRRSHPPYGERRPAAHSRVDPRFLGTREDAGRSRRHAARRQAVGGHRAHGLRLRRAALRFARGDAPLRGDPRRGQAQRDGSERPRSRLHPAPSTTRICSACSSDSSRRPPHRARKSASTSAWQRSTKRSSSTTRRPPRRASPSSPSTPTWRRRSPR